MVFGTRSKEVGKEEVNSVTELVVPLSEMVPLLKDTCVCSGFQGNDVVAVVKIESISWIFLA